MKPELVHRAEALATAMRFERSSIPKVGRLLAVLVAERPRGRFAEIGTGVGVASAWIVDALGPEGTFVSVELDVDRASAASRLLADHPNVRVLHGDWHELLPPEAPFDLLFFDGGHWKHGDVPAESEQALSLVAPGGIVVIDDLTPESLGPEERRGHADPVRDFWLGRDDLVATELLTTPGSSAILTVRR
jgi:predicted O-methyltransferase YrrM